MRVTIQYFEGCPNWRDTLARVESVLTELSLPISVLVLECIDSQEAAERAGFRGSPTVLIDGRDPFEDPGAPVGLACRLYVTPAGPAGSPDRTSLLRALRAGASQG